MQTVTQTTHGALQFLVPLVLLDLLVLVHQQAIGTTVVAVSVHFFLNIQKCRSTNLTNVAPDSVVVTTTTATTTTAAGATTTVATCGVCKHQASLCPQCALEKQDMF